jgi:alpha-L-arabinofuranosidase
MPTVQHATVNLDPVRTVGPVNRRLFGSFVEHLGRAVYGGIYEPAHPTATADGFRRDVLDLVAELGVTTVRYPGGNFVSGYRWEDGVGPRCERPRRLDLAWHSTETNQVGLDEFSRWTRLAGVELMYAVNLGTRGVQEALDVVEYANLKAGTRLSDWRVANGHPEPHDIRLWCLGNEMDGPWQLGHGTADEYGALAAKTARALHQFDPTLELVVCGSSSARMPTFGSWERTVLAHTYDDVDFISCHAYYEQHGDDLPSFLASGVDMDHFIQSVVAIADEVGAARGSDKKLNISFDEWNVWYYQRFDAVERITDVEHWPVAPRLLEDVYTVSDAVVVGGLLISLLRHADRVTAASLAQLVNVIAPIMTEPDGPAWRQTTFFPFALTARLAIGESLDVVVDCATYDTEAYGAVALVDAAATHDPATGRTAIFLVNRDIHSSAAVSIAVPHASGVLEALSLYDEDVSAANTLGDPTRVAPVVNTSATLVEGVMTISLPPVSWTAISLG